MAEVEQIEETKIVAKKSFKERCKKALPWVVGGLSTVSAAVIGYKFGRKLNIIDEDNIIGRYLAKTAERVSMGMEHAVHLIQDDKEYWMGMKEINKPDWWDEVDGTSKIIVSEVTDKISEK